MIPNLPMICLITEMPFPFISVTAVFAAQQHTSKMFNASLSFEILSIGRNVTVMNVLVSLHY